MPPFVIPIQSFDEPAAVEAVFAGATEFTATLTVASTLRATFAGETAFTADLSLALALDAAFVGASALDATLRLNAEPNVSLDAAFAGDTFFEATLTLGQDFAASFDGGTDFSAELTVAAAEEFGFTIFLDITGTELAAAANTRRYSARLLAGGTELPCRRIVETAAAGALGVSLDVTLARPDRTLVSDSSSLTFQVGVWSGTDFSWLTILSGGKRVSDTASYANESDRPADRVTFGALDLLSDRWTLRPAVPVTLYDPNLVDAPEPPDARSAIVTDGGTITPQSTPVPGLSMRAVLHQAYVTGCGFASVVTNIPDFPVREVTFTLEGGYHEAVKPLLGLYEPSYFLVGDALWIMNLDEALPAGLSPIVLSEAEVKTIEDAGPPRRAVTALIVEYREDQTGGDYFTDEPLAPEVKPAGLFGTSSWTETTTRTTMRRWRNTAHPAIVVREALREVKRTTLDWQFEILGRETQTFSFDALGRKSGHLRTVEARVPDLGSGGAKLLQTVSEETYTIFYRAGATAASDEIARTLLEETGLVLVDADKPYLGKPYEIPLRDAHRSGYIDPDANQSALPMAIRTVEKTYVREGASVEVRVQETSHLNGGSVDSTSSQTAAGSTAVSRRAQGVVRRMVTLSGGASDGRTVPTFSAGDIPPQLAIPLALRKLRRLNSPPRQVQVQLPYLDFRVRRGTIAEVRARGGVSLGTFLVEGYTRTYEAIGEGKQKFAMSLQARRLS